jgi:glucose-1-phosphate adenylyltransferase
MVSGGCVLSGGSIHGSLMFSRSRIDARSKVQESVILPDVRIGENCRIKRAVIDRGAVIVDGSEIGIDSEADRQRGFRVTESGVTLVTPDMLGQHLHHTR